MINKGELTMGENSSIIAFAKYFGTNEKNTIHFHGSEENVSAFLMVMEKYSIKRFDAPDFYIKDDRNRIVYIIEHFEIDCYKKGRKGSGFRLEESRIYKTIKELQKEYAYEEYHDIISAETSYDFYINNVIKTFEKHYNHIQLYKDNLKTFLSFNEDWQFKVVFFIEDVSPLGTQVYDRNSSEMKLVNIASSIEFLTNFKAKEDVDFILSCSSCNNENDIWFIDRNNLDEYVNNAENYSQMQFMNWKPNVFYFQTELK